MENMTLRENIAMHLLASLIVGNRSQVNANCECAVLYADALITALNEKNPDNSRVDKWSLEKDAKPGDILSVEYDGDNSKMEKIVIFTGLNDGYVKGYGIVLYNGNLHGITKGVPYYSETWTSNLKPATDKQKMELLQIMCKNNLYWDEKEQQVRYSII